MLNSISLAIGLVGTVASIFGFAYALYERRERVSLEQKTKSQQWATLDRARYVIGDHLLFEEFDKQLTHPKKHLLWNIHQAASDLYISLIEQYLSGVERFTYDDLKNLVANGVIYWHWQETQWRYAICQRPENRDVAPPPAFLEEPPPSAFRGSVTDDPNDKHAGLSEVSAARAA